MYAQTPEAVHAELAYRRARAADDLHHLPAQRRTRRARPSLTSTVRRAVSRRVG